MSAVFGNIYNIMFSWTNTCVLLLCLRAVLGRLVCSVTGDSKLGEGYNILSGEDCRNYCNLVPSCLHWTWYNKHCPTG